MHKFALKKIESASGDLEFFELVVDDVRPFKTLRNEIQDNPSLMSQLNTVFTIIDRLSKGEPVPEKKDRLLRNPALGGVEREIKTHELRVYYFKSKVGKIIVWTGFKKSQASDIVRFRSLKLQYLNSPAYEP